MRYGIVVAGGAWRRSTWSSSSASIEHLLEPRVVLGIAVGAPLPVHLGLGPAARPGESEEDEVGPGEAEEEPPPVQDVRSHSRRFGHDAAVVGADRRRHAPDAAVR